MKIVSTKYVDRPIYLFINPRLPKGGGYQPLKDYFPAR